MKKTGLIVLMICTLAAGLYPSGSTDLQQKIKDFNQALEDGRKGDFDKSLAALDKISPFTNKALEEKRLMLMSSDLYHSAEKQASEKGGIDEAFSRVEKAIGFLSGIVDRNPDNKNASNNLEMALLLRDNLENQKKNQAEQNRQNNQSTQNKLKDLAKKQRDLANDMKKGNPSHQEAQNQLNKSTEDLSNNSQQSSEDFRKNMENAREAQKNASEELKNGDFGKAAEDQNKAADSLDKALQSISSQKNNSNPPPDQQSGEAQQQKKDDGTDQMVQSIIENETDRESQKQNSTGNGISVERNW